MIATLKHRFSRSGAPPTQRPVPHAALDAMKRVALELEHGHLVEAATAFAHAYTDHTCTASTHSLNWVSDVLGHMATAKLIDAFLTLPCFYCSKGRQECEACEGRGQFDDGKVCERCLGFGVERCEFCSGSGWATLDLVPVILRPPVLKGRTRLVHEHLARLLAEPLPQPPTVDPRAALRECARLIIRIDRELGELENIFAVLTSCGQSGPEWLRLTEHETETWSQISMKVEAKLCGAFQTMAALLRVEQASVLRTPQARERAEQRATYYTLLAQTDVLLANGLHHTKLATMLRRPQGQSPANAGQYTMTAA